MTIKSVLTKTQPEKITAVSTTEINILKILLKEVCQRVVSRSTARKSSQVLKNSWLLVSKISISLGGDAQNASSESSSIQMVTNALPVKRHARTSGLSGERTHARAQRAPSVATVRHFQNRNWHSSRLRQTVCRAAVRARICGCLMRKIMNGLWVASPSCLPGIKETVPSSWDARVRGILRVEESDFASWKLGWGGKCVPGLDKLDLELDYDGRELAMQRGSSIGLFTVSSQHSGGDWLDWYNTRLTLGGRVFLRNESVKACHRKQNLLMTTHRNMMIWFVAIFCHHWVKCNTN